MEHSVDIPYTLFREEIVLFRRKVIYHVDHNFL
jgi:hypothetical protein